MKIIQRLRELIGKATPGPWGWTSCGEKCNAAFVGTFFTVGTKGQSRQIGGHVERDVWDEKKDKYVTFAVDAESIAAKDDNANFSDFALIVEVQNVLPALLAVAEAADRLVNPGTMTMDMTEQAKHYTASFAKLDAALRKLRKEGE